MIKFDGYDEAIIGSASVWQTDGTRVDRLIYDAQYIIQIMRVDSEMTYEEAREYVEYNIDGLYAGAHTPIVMWKDEDYLEDT